MSWQKWNKNDVEFSLHSIWGLTALVPFINGDVNFDHLIKVSLSGFFTIKLNLLFVTNKAFMGQYFQFGSVAQSCPTLCNPMNHSTPGLLVHHQLPEFTQTYVHWVSDAIQPISSSVIPFSSCLQSFPASGAFLMNQFFTSGGQRIGVSASASVLPMNIQDWFPLGWTGWIFLQSKGLSRVFSNTTVQKRQFFGAQLSL